MPPRRLRRRRPARRRSRRRRCARPSAASGRRAPRPGGPPPRGAGRARSGRMPTASSGQAARPRACCSPAASMSRAKSISCDEPRIVPEELHARLAELVRLVEDRHLDARQQLGDAAVAQRQVGEEQMVVDDHDVGGHRLAPGLVHVAAAELRALAAEAVLARRGHQRDDAAALVEAFELGEVAARRRLRPGLDLAPARGPRTGRAAARPGARGRGGAGTDSSPGPSAARCVTGTPRASRRRGRSRRKSWSCRVLVAVLSRVRAPRRAGPARGRRRSCRRRSRPRRRARSRRSIAAATASGHLQLLAPLDVMRVGRGERAAFGERETGRPLQRAHRSRSGRRRPAWPCCRCRAPSRCALRSALGGRRLMRAAAVRARLRCGRSGRAAARRRFFRRRRDRSSPPASAVARSIRLSRSACSIRSSIRRRGRECRLSVHRRLGHATSSRFCGLSMQGQSDYSFRS